MRIVIEVSKEQHRRLKIEAALYGQTMKDFLLSRAGREEEDPPMARLRAYLQEAVDEAARGGVSNRTVEEIFAQARRERKAKAKRG